MAKARKLPSGSWRALVYAGKDENGKRIYESFTAPTRKEAEYQAAEYALKKKRKDKAEDITVGEAIDRYISMKDGILSPSTLREYKSERKNRLKGLMGLKLENVTNELVQKEINAEAKKLSPKTVKNTFGLLTAALREFYPEMTLRISLPKAERPDICIPTKHDIDALLDKSKGTSLYIPILLASSMGLRRSEISALTWKSIDLKKGILKVERAKVLNDNTEWVIKDPKSYAGNRKLKIPVNVLEALKKEKRESEYLFNDRPSVISVQFKRLAKKINAPHLRFHDLRHYYASVMLSLNIPDKYAMERMGHATPAMLKNVYQHLMPEKEKQIDSLLDAYFGSDATRNATRKTKMPKVSGF